jgi:hypothetical protein
MTQSFDMIDGDTVRRGAARPAALDIGLPGGLKAPTRAERARRTGVVLVNRQWMKRGQIDPRVARRPVFAAKFAERLPAARALAIPQSCGPKT